jgi:TonB family protein
MEPSPTGRWHEPELHLLVETASLDRSRPRTAAIGSVLVHFAMALAALYVPWGPAINSRGGPAISIDPRPMPVFSVPKDLTQRAANKSTPSTEVNLEGLLAREQRPTPARTPGKTNPAAPPRPFQAPAAASIPAPRPVMEAPKIEGRGTDFTELTTRNLPGLGTPQVTPPPATPPPQIQTEEKPKLAFERPGGNTPSRNTGVAAGRMPMPPRSTVDDAVRNVAKSGGAGLVVGDLGVGVGGLGESLNNPAGPTKNATALELLSDPNGVDFAPYLIRVLSAVKRNWQAVIPESARLGRRGKVAIQFAISKDGSVPKLVISAASGTDALDRAAVAGISASNPFPPLPDEFRGGQLRLQMVFAYNIPK